MLLIKRLAAPCLAALTLSLFASCASQAQPAPLSDRPNIAGVYPHLAMMNNNGEAGTGAVVPWADRLWVVTYAPHMPKGSDDKLYEITRDLQQIIRPESIGGTPANRMIHRESQQLIIGPYFIDAKRNVRAIPYTTMPGRPTATARHLTDPANKIYITTMEEGLYEVDVKTLGVNFLINDSNSGIKRSEDAINSNLPGYHGKGSYTGQGKLIYANNGERSPDARRDPTAPSGALAQWGGPGKDWQLIKREQFTEVTGPGGIYGAPQGEEATAPIWAMGWDHRSLMLDLLDDGKWHTYRLPKASFSYDGAHGWNTEWPRIREIGTGDDLLATMHGTFWHFPRNFSLQNSAGIRPRSNYLKVVGDFARWGDYIVLGCDDSAKSEFLNKRPSKAKQAAPLRSNSNLWFVQPDKLSQVGPALGSGGVWLEDDIKMGANSDKYLLAGYDKRMLHLAHRGDEDVAVAMYIHEGNGDWKHYENIVLPPNSYMSYPLKPELKGQWISLLPVSDLKGVTAWFSYANEDNRTDKPAAIFNGFTTANTPNELGGVLRSLAGDDLPLGLIAQNRDNEDRPFYLLNKNLELVPSDNKSRRASTWRAAAPDHETIPLKIDGNSILVVEDGKRYRLPLNPDRADDKPFSEKIGSPRRVREVATERDMVNIAGTFYELPALNAGGFAHIRPIASHPFRVHDFCSWRGLLVMTGVDPKTKNDRIIKSADGKAAVWAGVIDDLWQLGKPRGIGGPWHNSPVKADTPSDPYLMYGYDNKHLTVTTDAKTPVTVTLQVDPSGTGQWHDYKTFNVASVKHFTHAFPDSYNAHWVRLISNTDATLTANFIFK